MTVSIDPAPGRGSKSTPSPRRFRPQPVGARPGIGAGRANWAVRIVYAVSITIGCSVVPLALRARMDGAVMRFPGTGEGVARLVLVSIVKVDMARPSNGPTLTPPEQLSYGAVTAGTPCCSMRRAIQVPGRTKPEWNDGAFDDRPPFNWRCRVGDLACLSDPRASPAADPASAADIHDSDGGESGHCRTDFGREAIQSSALAQRSQPRWRE